MDWLIAALKSLGVFMLFAVAVVTFGWLVWVTHGLIFAIGGFIFVFIMLTLHFKGEI